MPIKAKDRSPCTNLADLAEMHIVKKLTGILVWHGYTVQFMYNCSRVDNVQHKTPQEYSVSFTRSRQHSKLFELFEIFVNNTNLTFLSFLHKISIKLS